MSKITLLNTETGKLESFEPIDVREILSSPNAIYRVPDDEPAVGLRLESSGDADINVPQLQGSDAELQTGGSTQKYDREAVIKAEPGAPVGVLTTTGKVVDPADPRKVGKKTQS